MLRASNVASFWWPGSIEQGSSRQMTVSRDDEGEDRPCEKHLRFIIQTVVLLIYVGLTSVSRYACGTPKHVVFVRKPC